jgi:hypothetical protein
MVFKIIKKMTLTPEKRSGWYNFFGGPHKKLNFLPIFIPSKNIIKNKKN